MYVTVAPREPLSELVHSIWLYESEAPGHARDRRLPTGGVDLVVTLRDRSVYPDVVVSARLVRVARPPHPVVGRAAARIEAAPERCAIGELSEALGLSRRRFEQIFRADIGMTPKAYQRLQRFRRALARIEDATRVGWAGFALDRGYYDQAHLINEFGAHCGLTPREYLASRAGSFVNHVPITG
jgi:AraC-like DNA-binding protein